MTFKNNVYLVTGATSGMGEAVAIMLASLGAAIFVTGRDKAKGLSVVGRISSSGGSAEFLAGDVSDSQFCNACVGQAVSSLGRLDGLVNAAGMIHRGSALDTTDEQWYTSMRTNVDGSFFMSRSVVRHLVESKSVGSIVNFGSTCALVGAPGLSAYCASKGAIVQLTRAMALDHAKAGIRINAVCPGAVDTPMLMSGRKDSPLSLDEIHASNLTSIPQARIAQPDEVAELVCFLLSDASRHITGTAIPVDGGYTAQ